MGYRGMVAEQGRARDLRAEAWTLQEIADALGVAKSSVTLWVRDVEFEPRPRAKVARRREPNALQRRKQAEIDEQRLRLALYLHRGLDLDEAVAYWSALTQIPPHHFTKPYRAVPDPSIRTARHVHGCLSVRYSCSRTHRGVRDWCRRC